MPDVSLEPEITVGAAAGHRSAVAQLEQPAEGLTAEGPTAEGPTAEGPTAEELTAEELTAEELIEEISIDGMCGVY